MKHHRLFLALAILSLTALFCGGTAPAQDVQKAMAGTMQALTAQAEPVQTEVAKQLTQTPPNATAIAPATGGISGKLVQSAKSPPVRVIAFLEGSDQYYAIEVQPGDQSYQINDLPPGIYHVVAYDPPSQYAVGAAAGYTQYVLCGMGSSCNDHALVDINVVAGQVFPNADVLDTYQMPDYPMDPLAFGTDNIPVTTPPGDQTGSITGRLTYPASGMPAVAVIAFKVDDVNEYYYITTVEGQDTYEINNLPKGSYHVIAYTLGGAGFPAGFAGGYTAAVPCGLTVQCTDHSLLPVQVNAGMVNDEIIPGDFYAPEGSFPAYPLP